jgi:heavy metal sensor kinase
MFLRALKRITRTFGFRLAVSFSLAFVLGSFVLFGFAYILVSSSLLENDRTAIQLKLKEYADEYQKASVRGVSSKVATETNSGKLRRYMVRLASPRNETILLKSPEEGVNYDFHPLEQNHLRASGAWIQLKAPDEDDVLDVASLLLPDQSVLQIGKGPEDREDVLEKFENTFLVLLGAMVILSSALGTLLARQALRPVRGLIDVLGPIIDTGKIKSRIPVRSTGDEFEKLASRFNQALERIDNLIEAMRASLDSVAHDLRTPMTRLRGVAEMALQSAPHTETYREALADCLEESDHVLQMLNVLMDISEVEAGSVRLAVDEVNVRALLNYVCELYQVVAEDKSIKVQIECPDDLRVLGDRNRLRQVFANLLDNALKYTPAGGTVRLEATSQRDKVSIQISDCGTGISPEDLPRIWDRFYRGDKSRTQRGLGLGLSLVKAVVQAHKGEIVVSSEPSQGSRFVISLPRVDRPAS